MARPPPNVALLSNRTLEVTPDEVLEGWRHESNFWYRAQLTAFAMRPSCARRVHAAGVALLALVRDIGPSVVPFRLGTLCFGFFQAVAS